jgi:DNA-nicking Smr family endonuclease
VRHVGQLNVRSPKPPPRIFALPDHALWDDVAQTISPLRKSSKAARAAKAKPVTPIAPWSMAARPLAAAAPSFIQRSAPPLASFERRLAQKLSRGQMEPEASLDLHGDGLEIARMRLLQFLTREQQNGTRLVLVVTVKGDSPYARHTLHGLRSFIAPERQGRLRREVPEWLNEAIFRSHVVGYQPAIRATVAVVPSTSD